MGSIASEIGSEVTLHQGLRGQFEIAASNDLRGLLGGRGLNGLSGLGDQI